MFIFIDITTLQKELKRSIDSGERGEGQGGWILIKTFQCLRLFFIPIWHWGEKYYVVDERSRTRYEISEEDAILVQYNKKDIEHCKMIVVEEAQSKCPHCRQVCDSEYTFCPHCGQKRK